jgi:hypothetical protein
VRATITVLDDGGEPVRGAWVRARESQPRRPEPEGRRFAGAGGFWGEGWRGSTDAEGVVVLEHLEPDTTYLLHVAAPRDRPELRDASVLEGWRPRDGTAGDTIVRLRRWRVVRGVVRDLQGSAVVGAHVTTGQHAERRFAATDAAGAFMLERLPDGALELDVDLPHGLLHRGADPARRSLASCSVAEGEESAVCSLDVGRELVVRLLDGGTATPARSRGRSAEFEALANLWLPVEGGEGARASAHAYVRDGMARFRGLRAGEVYALWLSPSEDGGIVYETDVRAGTLDVVRRPGRPITVHVRAPAQATTVSASVRGPWLEFDQARRSPPGPIEVRGVPEGTWKVWAWAKVGEEFWTGWGSASAGSSCEVEVLPPRPAR